MKEPRERLLLVGDREAAAILSVSRMTLWRLRKDGALPFVRIGRRVLYRVEDLERWIEAHTVGAEGRGE